MANLRLWMLMAVVACLLLSRAAIAEAQAKGAGGKDVLGGKGNAADADDDEDDDTYYPNKLQDQDNQEEEPPSPSAQAPDQEDDNHLEKDDDVEEFMDTDQELIVLGH